MPPTLLTARVPVEPDRHGNPSYSPVAGALGGAATLMLALVAAWVALTSRFLDDHRLWAYVAIAAAGLIGFLATYAVAAAVFRRYGARWWHVGVAVAALVCIGSQASAFATWVFPDPMARYDRQLGGPGRCLHNSPYGTGKPNVTTISDAGWMTVVPLDTTFPPLRLDHAVAGGLHQLTPADGASRQILDSHGC
ncbi:hypothetical protein [Streptacidiphilus albus]|uniref:hypothetical protein n=1 Tax=Streptacidiphilus albus TaxID=105425 RepID=UPI000689B7C8|nr:hypothetical protein [Streptacidiphilus albus]